MDIGIAALLYVLIVVGPHQQLGHLNVSVALWGAVMCAALVFRRRWPLQVLLITALVSLAYFVVNQRAGPTVGGTAIAIFTVSVTKPRRISLPVGLLCVLIFGVLGMGFARGSWMDPDNLIVATWCALAVAAGEATKNRRACAPRRAQPGAMCRRGWPGTCSTNSQNRPSRRWRTSGRRAEPRWTSLASTIGLLRQPDDRAAPTEPSVGLARRQGCE